MICLLQQTGKTRHQTQQSNTNIFTQHEKKAFIESLKFFGKMMQRRIVLSFCSLCHARINILFSIRGCYYPISSDAHANYGQCLKISNKFHFRFLTKMLVIRAGIHKMLIRIANREDPNQTASSSEAV